LNFEATAPATRILFGAGRLCEVAGVVAGLGSRPLLVYGSGSARSSGALHRLTADLRRADLEVAQFGGVRANPGSDQVDAAVAVIGQRRSDVLVALGGGSVIDVAKAVAVCVAHGPAGPLVGLTLPQDPRTLPVVAIPTTAGSGAEVTRGATIFDVERRVRAGIRGDDLFPKVAVVDPELTSGLPRQVGIESGFDALAHAVEGYLATAATPLNAGWATAAVELVVAHLPAVAAECCTAPVREAMCLAALLGGLNVATAGTCLPHRLQQAMASVFAVQPSHGAGLAAVYPAWLRCVESAVPHRCGPLASLLGDGLGLAGSLTRLLHRVGLPVNLTELGATATEASALAAAVTGRLDNDPLIALGSANLGEICTSAQHTAS